MHIVWHGTFGTGQGRAIPGVTAGRLSIRLAGRVIGAGCAQGAIA